MEATEQGMGAAIGESSGTTGERGARISERAHETVDRLAGTAHGMADRMSRQGEQWMMRQDELVQQVRGFVRERPIAALAVAAAVGFVLSRLSR
jgi:ElaB/YqjD/DUF883 family membrane-anchored ribosome-binding protein